MSILFALISIVLFLFLSAAIVSGILYWYETLNSPCDEIPSPKPGVLSCAQIYLHCLVGYVTAIILYPAGFFWQRKPSPLNPEPAQGKAPVILVHGLNDNSSVMFFLYFRLKRQGYPVFIFSYFSLFVPFEKTCARFDDFVHMVEASFPGKKPVLVGHSLGGLIIRRWLGRAENHMRPLGVVTLATPHKGSKMAVFAPGAVARLLRPGSSLITELQASAPVEGIPCVSLVSPTDEAVLPASSLIPPQGWKMRVTNRASHHGMLFCARVFKLLTEELRAIENSACSIAGEDGPAEAS